MWAKENKIEQYPDLQDFWRVVASAVATQVFKKAFEKFAWPLCKVIANHDGEETIEETAKRMAVHAP